MTIFIVLGLAEANTSAGAPPVMLAASESLPPKEKVTFVPGCSFSNFLPSVVKLSFSEAAANTVTSPESLPDEEADAEESDFDEEESSDDEQALSASSAAAPAPATCRVRRFRRAVRVFTGPLPLVLTDAQSLAAPADHTAVRPHPSMIMPQMRGESLLSHRMSWVGYLWGSHVRLYETVVESLSLAIRRIAMTASEHCPWRQLSSRP